MRYYDKMGELVRICSGKRVLHLGCVGETDADVETRVAAAKELLHWQLTQVADVVGIDYAKEVVDEYERLGIFDNIMVGNVEHLDQLDIEGSFDVVVAGDIIEHLSNPGLMLDGIQRFCRPDTILVVNTPHTQSLPGFMRFVFGRYHEAKEHVMGFNALTLSTLLRRHGYAVDSIDTCFQPQSRGHALFSAGRFFLSAFPRFGGTLFVQAHSVLAEKSGGVAGAQSAIDAKG
ncbi:MAG: methyltransferase domain-containing protein [Rhodothermales bacterium]|nr:methyltransferase domain-containing protein [Rhodothermales bacterium]